MSYDEKAIMKYLKSLNLPNPLRIQFAQVFLYLSSYDPMEFDAESLKIPSLAYRSYQELRESQLQVVIAAET
jgi:hypothetical protein